MPSPGGLQALNSLMDICCPWTKEWLVSKESLIITELIELFGNPPLVLFHLIFFFLPADYTCTHVYSQTTQNPQTFLEADCFLLLRNPHIFLAVHYAFMWLSHTVAQWNLLKELPTHQIFHELGPDTSMRGKTMSETRPALAFCLVCVTAILPAALLHSTSYFSDHQKAPWILSVIAGAQAASVFSQPLAPGGSRLDLESFLCVFVLFCCYFYEWLSQGTLTPAQSYPAIHKKQTENIVLCPVGNRLWYWPRLSRILVIQDLCYRSASCWELPGRARLLPARFPVDLGSGVQHVLCLLP